MRVSQNELFSSEGTLFVWNQIYFYNLNNKKEAYLYFEIASIKVYSFISKYIFTNLFLLFAF
ncbi:hypothetical protein BN177_460115 [Clostridioides difficile E24]|nr:hypothetical protein BN177_460115 [Clostridioides difficile E24]CCL46726.1 hypothetical protein BN178_700115 [Clostridioides difficile T42]